MSQGRQNPVLDGLRARLELLDDSDLEHHAMATGFQELREFGAAKAGDPDPPQPDRSL
jgi:hypothetical protein